MKEPFNGDGNCRSWGNLRRFGIPLDGDINILTNSKDGEFTIDELEIWEVTNSKLEKQKEALRVMGSKDSTTVI